MGNLRQPRLEYLICLFLILITAAVYWQVTNFDFVNFDDDVYVQKNPAVRAGLYESTAKWALTTVTQSNWHPLTWMSLMMDSSLSGVLSCFDVEIGNTDAGVYHLTNLVLHEANTILLFVLLLSITRCRWRSALVAALFAVHPLHVESVAWVTERKDVLSTLFWLLTMLAYIRYVRQPRKSAYWWIIVFFGLGLMAKPMLVTLPLVLLLIDVWPLRRIDISGDYMKNLRAVVVEKIPLFAMTALSCVVTFYAQRAGGAVGTFQSYPLGVRIANAVVAYVMYLVKTIWPANLAILYPHPGKSLPVWLVIISFVVLITITVMALRSLRRFPSVAVGWLWYLITLIPVIGIVQVGKHAMADRYTYVSLIGIFMIIAWGIPDLLRPGVWATRLLSAASVIVILTLSAVAYRTVGYWQDSATLFGHAIKVTDGNSLAYNNLGNALLDRGESESAEKMFRQALRYHSEYTDAKYNLGNALCAQGKVKEAMSLYSAIIRQYPKHTKARNNLGVLLAQQGRTDEAIAQFTAVLKINPHDTSARDNLELAKQSRQSVPAEVE
ncbi:tetratricopeptide repeat protein [bacterium]|nr:tetratricopeptide repeat protein [bacterium]